MRKFILSLAVLALAVSPALAGKYNKKVSIGEKAPDFAGIPAYDPATKETTSLTLKDLKDDVVVLVFLANHCPVVVNYEDRIIDFVNDYKDKNVKVVGVSVSDSKVDNLEAIKKRFQGTKKDSNYLYGSDETQAIGRAYGATNTPQFFVLDKDRVIRYMGAMDDSQNEANVKTRYLRSAVDALLAGKSIPEGQQETRPVGCGIGYKN